MPPALRYDATMTGDYNQKLDRLYTQERVTRQQRMDALLTYYAGQHKPPTYADGQPLPQPIIVNLVELIADKAVASMLGIDDSGIIEGVRFQVPEPDAGMLAGARRVVRTVREIVGDGVPVPMPHEAKQQAVDALWAANNKNLLLTQVMLHAALTGHVFVKLLPEALTHEGVTVPRLVLLDSRNVSLFWDAADGERVLWYRSQYDLDGVDMRRREDVVREVDEAGQDTGQWIIHTYEQTRETGTWGAWRVVGDPVVWPYPFAPIVHWRNMPSAQGVYGRDDFGVMMQLNDALNTNVSVTHQIALNYSYPRYFGTGIDGIKQEDDIDGIWFTQNADAKMSLLEMQGDLGAVRGFGESLRRMIFDQGRELDPSTVQDKLGDLTNFALRVLNDDRLGKRATKWLHAANGLTQLTRHALTLMAFADVRVDVIPPDPLPFDPLSRAQAYALHRANGLSEETYLERQGFDPDAERRRRGTETQRTTRNQLATQEATAADALAAQGRALRQQMTQGGGNGTGPDTER